MSVPVTQAINAQMAPVPLSVVAGQTITLTFTCLDPTTSAPIDLTGQSVLFAVRAIVGFQLTPTGPALIAHACTLAQDPTTGVCSLTLVAADTLTLAGDGYGWDLTLVGAGSPGPRTPMIPQSPFVVANTVGLPTDTYT